jgi:hypothetical protein
MEPIPRRLTVAGASAIGDPLDGRTFFSGKVQVGYMFFGNKFYCPMGEIALTDFKNNKR